MSKTEMAILGLLAERSMHGYEIKQTVKDRWMDMWALISLPSIYNTLNRLAGKKYIEEHKEKIGKTPERNVYFISKHGKKYLTELVEKGLQSDKSPDSPFWLAVAFVDHTDKETAINAMNDRIDLLEKNHAELEKQRQKYKGSIPYNWYVLIENGLAFMQVEIKQIRSLIKQMNRERVQNATADSGNQFER